MDYLALWQNRIDNAAILCGSQNKLAEKLGIRGSRMSAIRHGKEAIPQEKLKILAEMIGANDIELMGLQAAVRKIIGSPYRSSAGTTRKTVLRLSKYVMTRLRNIAADTGAFAPVSPGCSNASTATVARW